jgi:signal transduction histidine kinase
MLSRRQTAGYIAVLAAAFALAALAGYSALGGQVDLDAYDWMFRLRPPEPWPPQSALLAIDERTLLEMGGVRRLRSLVAEGLERLAGTPVKAVAIDLTLAEEGDPADDARLEAAMRRTPNLVLAAELLPKGEGWQEPIARFRQCAAAVGHVHAAPDELDGVNRQIPLEKAATRKRYWALSLEAFRLSRGVQAIIESPDDLEAGSLTIPARRADARAMRIRYRLPAPDGSSPLPRVSIHELRTRPERAAAFRDKAVFIGVTAQSAARDRLVTPFSADRLMPGVEIHASAFETLAQGMFLTSASNLSVLLFSLALTAAAGLVFAFLAGWGAYALGALLIVSAHAVPFLMYVQGTVFPVSAPVAAAWLSVAGAASYQHFVVRRQLRRAEAEKSRYQQAVHFVTHEMRTPLTAIQGSSELMSRYNLNDEKRKQIADLIHDESRRLARMVETFLSVERLSAGQMELKREKFRVQPLTAACVDRVRPLADRKRIGLHLEDIPDEMITGDRELMEYAIYNLLTNAVKYSPAETDITVSGRREGGHVHVAVRDQGIGMDAKELRSIFQKFYRTRKAMDSGERGTGIGLSIVEQIVSHHGGRIEVSSAPGRGSCFTLVLPAPVSATAES